MWDSERVKKAGLGGNHNKYPLQMKAARCISEGVRASFPACLCGFYTPEEVQDFDTPKRQKENPVVEEEKETTTAPKISFEDFCNQQLKRIGNFAFNELLYQWNIQSTEELDEENRKHFGRQILAIKDVSKDVHVPAAAFDNEEPT
jgi:hypothetical protein